MSLIAVGPKEYLCALELSEKYPSFFLGAKARYIRRIVEKQNIPADAYIYAAKQGDKWIASTHTYKRAKLLLERGWVQLNIQGNDQEEKYQPCPPAIDLLDTDRFRDDNGKLFEVKIVGERSENGCFFKAVDISSAFGVPNLRASLLNIEGNYKRGRDYRTFDCSKRCGEDSTYTVANTLQTFLTFDGLLRVLYSSRTGNANEFRKWCTSVLFRSTFGAPDEKRELAEDILDLPSKTLKNVLSKSATDIPVIYLFRVYPPNSPSRAFYKFGRTCNFKRRADELKRKFKEMNLADELELFSYVDSKYIFQAEAALKSSLTAVRSSVKIENCADTEFVNLPLDKGNFIRDQFRMIASMYAGQTFELQRDMEVMKALHETEIQLLRKEMEIQLQAKEIEILRLKLQLANCSPR
jgi:hypothetical protein